MVNHDTGAERDVPAEIERLTNGPKSGALELSDHPFVGKIGNPGSLTGEEPVGREFYWDGVRDANGVGEYVRVTSLSREGQELFGTIGVEVPHYTIEVALVGPPPKPGEAEQFVSMTLHLDSLCGLYGVAVAQNYPELTEGLVNLHDLRMQDWGLVITRTVEADSVLVNAAIANDWPGCINAPLAALA